MTKPFLSGINRYIDETLVGYGVAAVEDYVSEFIKAIIWTTVATLQIALLGAFGAIFWMWIDVRSLKKGNRVLFGKTRNLEKETLGHVTSELDTKPFERKEER